MMKRQNTLTKYIKNISSSSFIVQGFFISLDRWKQKYTYEDRFMHGSDTDVPTAAKRCEPSHLLKS